MPARSRVQQRAQRLDGAVERAQARGVSANAGLEAYRKRSRAAGGRGVRRQDWLDRWELVRIRNAGIDPASLPPRRGAGSRTRPSEQKFTLRRPGPTRWHWWILLTIREPDGTERDQNYDHWDTRRISDRLAVLRAIGEWNALTRKAPISGSLTGAAVGGRVLDVHPVAYSSERSKR